MRRDQLAVGAVDHVHETILVGTQQRLADLTIDTQIGKHRLGRAVEVEAFIWNVLIVPNQLAGLRPDRDHAGCIKTVGVIAIRPKTGELVWHYQYIPNESFDFDGSAEPVLADLRIDGQVRKALLSANKNGFMYVIDRTNGQLIAAHPFVKVNWASHIDLKTGRPVLTDIYDQAVKGETVEIWPSRGTNASLMAFNPKTGLVYVNSWEIARILKYSKFEFVLGQGSTGVETSFRTPPAGEPWGYHMAFNPLTGKAWKVPV